MIYSFLDPQFWLAALVFILAIVVSCYAFGSLIIRRFHMAPLAHLVVSLSVGLVFWAAQGYVLGYLNQRWLTYGYVLVSLLMLLKTGRSECEKVTKAFQRSSWSWLLILILATGVFTQVIQVGGSGLKYEAGVGFFRVNAYDGVLHLGFISAMQRQVPPIEPGAAGIKLANYHYWSDLTMAELVRIWRLPISHVFFQFFPVLLSLLTGLSLIAALQHWSRSKTEVTIATFLLYFGGDLTYLLMLLLNHTWGFHAAAIDIGATQFLNMPHSFAKSLFIASLIPLYTWHKTKKLSWGILSISLLASLFAFKVYFGMFGALILFFLGISWLFGSVRANWHKLTLSAELRVVLAHLVGLAVLFSILVAIVYLPTNKGAGGLFWSPLEWPKLFLGPENLNWQTWWLRQQVYEAAQNWKVVWVFNAIAVAICLLCVYGVRLLGAVVWPTAKNRADGVWLLSLLLPCYIFTFLGLFTLQTSGGFNVFNFFAVSNSVLAITLAFNLAWLWNLKQSGWKLVALLIIVAAVPRSLFHLHQAVTQQVNLQFEQVVSPAELELLQSVSGPSESDLVIQSHPSNRFDAHTPYVSYFTGRQTYFAGEMMLTSHNQDISGHRASLTELFKINDAAAFRQQASSMGISAIYLQREESQRLPFLKDNALPIIFENEAGAIYRVQ